MDFKADRKVAAYNRRRNLYCLNNQRLVVCYSEYNMIFFKKFVKKNRELNDWALLIKYSIQLSIPFEHQKSDGIFQHDLALAIAF